jgi:hypothetical protein
MPAVITLGLLAAAWGVRRRKAEPAPLWAGSIAVAAGFAAAYIALFGWPPLPPKEKWQWLPYLAVLSAVLNVVLEWKRVPPFAGWATTIIVVLCACLLVPDWQEPWWVWCGGLGLVMIVLWAVLHAWAQRGLRASLPLALLIAATCGAFVLERAATAKFAQLAGALAACCGACLVFSVFARTDRLVAGIVAPCAILLPGLMSAGLFNHFSDVSAVSFVLPSVAPVGVWVAAVGPLRQLKAWKRVALTGVAVLVPAAIGLALAIAAASSAS